MGIVPSIAGVGAMSAGTEYFENPLSLGAVRSWDSLLRRQADIFFPSDVPFLKQTGMGATRQLLDLGCGADYYTDLLKKHFPRMNILAADTNPDLLAEYEKRRRETSASKVTTFRWTAGQNNVPVTFKDCDAVLARLVLQHVADPLRIIQEMYDFLPQGARVFILEEDDGAYCTSPNLPAFDRLMGCWRKLAQKHRANRYIGREIPRLMGLAGFQVKSVDLVAHTNATIGLRVMFEFFLDSLNAVRESDSSIVSADQVAKITEEMNQYLREYGEKSLFNYPHYLVVGQK